MDGQTEGCVHSGKHTVSWPPGGSQRPATPGSFAGSEDKAVRSGILHVFRDSHSPRPAPRRPLGSVVRACAPQAAEAQGLQAEAGPPFLGSGALGWLQCALRFSATHLSVLRAPGPAYSRTYLWISAAGVAEGRATTCGRGSEGTGTAPEEARSEGKSPGWRTR